MSGGIVRLARVVGVAATLRRWTRWAVVAVASISVAYAPVASASARAQGGGAASARADQMGVAANAAARDLAQLLVGSKPGLSVTNAQTMARLDRLVELLKAADAAVPRETFDLTAIVARVGRDPRALAGWVRDQTALVPYRGTLRGAVGVLMDRTGNSLDRSLLLAGLLRSAGATARLAHVQLSPDQAAALWKDATAKAQVSAPATAWTSDGKFIDDYAAGAGQDAQAIRKGVQRVTTESDRVRADVKARVAAQTAALVKMAGVASTLDSVGDKAVEALRDHWWVEWQNGAAWTPLDSALATGTPPFGSAQAALQPDQVPANLHHEVEIRVVVEQWDGVSYRESRPLAHRLRPADVLDQRIVLHQVPMNWPREASVVLGTRDLSGFKTAVTQEHEWLPTLVIGDRVVQQSSFTDTGEVNAKPGTRSAPAVAGILDAFGGGEEPPKTPGLLTAAWIEYEIRSPASPVRVVRREIFDFAGPGTRAAKRPPSALSESARWTRGISLLGTTEILAVGAQISEPYVAHLIGTQVTAAVPGLKNLVQNAETLSGQAAIDAGLKLKPMSVRLHELAVARNRWSRAPGGFFLSQPNVLTRHAFMTPDDRGGFHMGESFDIVANEVEAIGPQSVVARVEQGVLDSNAETVLIGPDANGASTPDLFGAESALGPWITVRRAADVQSAGLSADAAARVAADVKAGYIVVVPRSGATTGTSGGFGWWRIDPRTGDTLAIGNRGWGQAFVEYSATKAVIVAVAMQLGCAAVVSFGNPNGLTLRMWLTCSVGSIGVMAAGFGFPLLAAAFGFVLATGIWGNDNPALNRRVF